MENTTTVRLDLGISAQKIIQQIKINNKHIENQLAKGIELALKEIDEEGFVNFIKDQTKIELMKIINNTIFSWEMRNHIEKVINNNVTEKVSQYANKIADKLISSLESE